MKIYRRLTIGSWVTGSQSVVHLHLPFGEAISPLTNSPPIQLAAKTIVSCTSRSFLGLSNGRAFGRSCKRLKYGCYSRRLFWFVSSSNCHACFELLLARDDQNVLAVFPVLNKDIISGSEHSLPPFQLDAGLLLPFFLSVPTMALSTQIMGDDKVYSWTSNVWNIPRKFPYRPLTLVPNGSYLSVCSSYSYR